MERTEKSPKPLFKKWCMRLLLTVAILVGIGRRIFILWLIFIFFCGIPPTGPMYEVQAAPGGGSVITVDGVDYVYDESDKFLDNFTPSVYLLDEIGQTHFMDVSMDVGFFISDTARSVLIVHQPNTLTTVFRNHAFIRSDLSIPPLTADSIKSIELLSCLDTVSFEHIPIEGTSPCTDPGVIADLFDAASQKIMGDRWDSRYATISMTPADPAFAGFIMRYEIYTFYDEFRGCFAGEREYVAIPRELLERIAGCKLY